MFMRAMTVLLLATTAIVAHAQDVPKKSTDNPLPGCESGSKNEGFWQRLADSYKRHLFPSDPANTGSDQANTGDDTNPSGYRPGLQPPPESVPPWPYSTWPMGARPAIGYENMYYGPLMDAIWCGRNGRTVALPSTDGSSRAETSARHRQISTS